MHHPSRNGITRYVCCACVVLIVVFLSAGACVLPRASRRWGENTKTLKGPPPPTDHPHVFMFSRFRPLYGEGRVKHRRVYGLRVLVSLHLMPLWRRRRFHRTRQ